MNTAWRGFPHFTDVPIYVVYAFVLLMFSITQHTHRWLFFYQQQTQFLVIIFVSPSFWCILYVLIAFLKGEPNNKNFKVHSSSSTHVSAAPSKILYDAGKLLQVRQSEAFGGMVRVQHFPGVIPTRQVYSIRVIILVSYRSFTKVV